MTSDAREPPEQTFIKWGNDAGVFQEVLSSVADC